MKTKKGHNNCFLLLNQRRKERSAVKEYYNYCCYHYYYCHIYTVEPRYFEVAREMEKKFDIAGCRNNRGSVKFVTVNHLLIKYVYIIDQARGQDG